MTDNSFIPITLIARMFCQRRDRVIQWVARSSTGQMQKYPLPEGSYRKNPITGLWEVSVEGMEQKLQQPPTWTLDQVLAGEDKKDAT